MTYIDQIGLAQDPAFLKRVEYVITQSAVNIRAEPANTPNHVARSNWAGQVLGAPEALAKWMAPGFVTQPNVAGTAALVGGVYATTVTDAQLQVISDSLWNDYAVA